MPRPKQRTPELRDDVLAAAVQVLATAGPAGLTARRVASDAGTSTSAVYEFFGDKGGLIRAVFFEGFRMLRRHLDGCVDASDDRLALHQIAMGLRSFIQDNPVLARVMFERPFADFDPGPQDVDAGTAVREYIVGHVRSAVEAGVLHGDPTDLAHVLLGLTIGLATQESAGWLGTSRASSDRRWSIGIDAVLAGLSSSRAPGTAMR
jgi:AcrR family transcriptional regulator